MYLATNGYMIPTKPHFIYIPRKRPCYKWHRFPEKNGDSPLPIIPGRFTSCTKEIPFTSETMPSRSFLLPVIHPPASVFTVRLKGLSLAEMFCLGKALGDRTFLEATTKPY